MTKSSLYQLINPNYISTFWNKDWNKQHHLYHNKNLKSLLNWDDFFTILTLNNFKENQLKLVKTGQVIHQKNILDLHSFTHIM